MGQTTWLPLMRSLLLFFWLPTALCEPVLKQVHVITRHGSRRPLAKTSTTLKETEPEKSLLTALGQQQHYQLGLWLRNRYAQHEDYFSRALSEFDPMQVRLESSQYERTISSASSLALGLFPLASRGLVLIPETPANIPVYTQEGTNDIVIRAYDKCPTFQDRLDELYTSELWTIHEANHKPILRRLARFDAFAEYQVFDSNGDGLPYIPLKDVWNAFDQVNVIKTECPTLSASQLCTELPHREVAQELTDNEWAEVKSVAHFAELTKYSPPVAGTLLGGPLLQLLLDRMTERDLNGTTPVMDTDEYKVPYKFYLTSAHYPTLLGLFSALGWQFAVDDDQQVIPEYAAALIFEVYQDDQTLDKSVQMWYKVGADSGDSVIALRLNDDCPTDTGCPLTQFDALVKPLIMTNFEWCGVCNNIQADVCLQEQLKTCSNVSHGSSYASMVAPFFVGMAVAIVLYILVALCLHRNNLRARLQRNREAEDVAALTTDVNEVKTPSRDEIDIENESVQSASVPPETDTLVESVVITDTELDSSATDTQIDSPALV